MAGEDTAATMQAFVQTLDEISETCGHRELGFIKL